MAAAGPLLPSAPGPLRAVHAALRSRRASAVRCFQRQSSGSSSRASRAAAPAAPVGHEALEEIVNGGPLPPVAATPVAASSMGAGLVVAELPALAWVQEQGAVSGGAMVGSSSNGTSRGGNGTGAGLSSGAPGSSNQQAADGRAPHHASAHVAEEGGMPAGPSSFPVAAAAAAEAEAAAPPAEPYTLQKKVALAGGVLDLVHLQGDRLLRIWMPPGYSREEAARHPLPLLILNDGQNLFDDRLSFSGCSWRAGEAAAALITSGQLPPFLILGIDHAGANRSLEYLPYKPGTGPGGFRRDAAEWPGGDVGPYLDRVFTEIVPWVQATYGAATDPVRIAFGGSSFGGICTLCACMRHGGSFGAALVESASLWFAEERFLREDLAAYSGPWPQRLFLAMGSREFTGTRLQEAQAGGAQWDALLVRHGEELAVLLGDQGLGPDRLQWEIGEGAAHTESAWAARLPSALRFLLAPWWADAAAAHAADLFFTSPRRLQAGQPATLFVNRARSTPLAGSAGPLQMRFGFNNWSLGGGEAALQPTPQLDAAAAGQQHQHQHQHNSWHSFSFVAPEKAYEMQFVLTDGQRWDNNAGADFYVRVKLPQAGPAARMSPEAVVAAAAASAEGPADEVASRSGSRLFFTTPEVLVAGAPGRLYFNRARSWPLADKPNVKARMGFNDWQLEVQDQALVPAPLWRGEGVEWWATQPFQVPEDAFDLTFCFTDCHGAYDSNDGLNYMVPVWQPQRQQEAPPRTVASSQVIDHAGGKLHIINLTKRAGKERWTEEKVIRVWTPPGYSCEAAPPGGWPVLWLCDGSNKFEDHLAHQGHAWNVGYCAEGLIRHGVLPPFVVAAVDSVGPMRSLNYLPYKPGTGLGGFRGDAERWPGGGCEGYMQRVVQELMPLVQHEFNTATDPAKVAFGGGSFAGVTALYAAMHYPHVFGAVLAESPSLWIAEGRFLQDMWQYKGALPERIFIGCGTAEYSATRDHERPEIDDLLLHYYKEAALALEAAGMKGPQRLRFLIEEGAGHHEKAWAWRLSGALTFLLSPWWAE